jgi:hypothetical protein
MVSLRWRAGRWVPFEFESPCGCGKTSQPGARASTVGAFTHPIFAEPPDARLAVSPQAESDAEPAADTDDARIAASAAGQSAVGAPADDAEADLDAESIAEESGRARREIDDLAAEREGSGTDG